MLGKRRAVLLAVAASLVLGTMPASTAPLDTSQEVDDTSLENLAEDLYNVDNVAVYNFPDDSNWEKAFPE